MHRHLHKPSRHSRRSFVLLAVLVVVVLLSLAAYQFSDLMLAEYSAADSYTRSAQARALADSGVHYAAAVLSNPDAFTNTLHGNPYDNPQAFQGVLVNPQAMPHFQGRFSLIAPLNPDDPTNAAQPYRFGVTDESGKMNLNSLMRIDSSGQVAHDMLMTLPNMTEDVANSILDWIDPDDEPRANGAEGDYYSTQTPPYRPKNGPLDSLEELLFVKGVTPQLLLGNDQNRSGVLNSEEGGGGTLDRGWAPYLTVYSREKNVDSQGNPRINVNDSNLDTLYPKLSTALGPDLANFIMAYRVYGPAQTQTTPGQPGSKGNSPAAGGGATSRGSMGGAVNGGSLQGGSTPRLSQDQINSRGGRPRPISSLFELINAQVSIPGNTPEAPPTIYPSPLKDAGSIRQLLPLLLDECTTVKSTEIPARINVNTASRTVLTALPGIGDADVQNILAHRPNPSSADTPDPIFQTPAWLITEASISPVSLKRLDPFITTRSQVYRLQVVGYFDGGGPSARVEAVIDTNQGNPRIIYYRDLTELGKGFNLAGAKTGP